MDHKQLKYFLALADTLHFGRASELCHVSAPTLSRQIKQLEEEVGSLLFLRDNRTVSLTHQGTAFIGYAKATLAKWQQFKSDCHKQEGMIKGELSLYCSVTASYSFTHKLFAHFRQRYPEVELNLNTGDPTFAISQVASYKSDLAVSVKPKTMPKGIAYQKLGSSELVVIAPMMTCPLTLLLNENEDIPWHKVPFIMPEQGVLKERIDEFAQQLSFSVNVYSHVAGHEAMVALASLGFGVAIVPDIVLSQSPFKDQVVLLKTPKILNKIEIGIVCKQKKLSDPVINALWTTVKTIF
jgi:LysR family transcriptional regulator, positive regulator for ilvC